MKFLAIGKPIEALADEIERLEQDNARLRALIKETEIIAGAQSYYCPWCCGRAPKGHDFPGHDADCPAFNPNGEVK